MGGGYCLFFRDCRDGGLFFSEMGGGGVYCFNHSCFYYIVYFQCPGDAVSTVHACIILYVCFQCPGDAVSTIHTWIVRLFSVSWRCCFNHPYLDCTFVFSVLEMLFQLLMLALYCMFVFSVLEMLFQPSMLGLYVCFQCPGDAVSTIHAWIVCLFLVSRSCCFNRLWLHDIVHLFSVSQSCCFSHQCLEWSRQDWLRRWIMCSRSLTFPHRTDCVRYSTVLVCWG